MRKPLRNLIVLTLLAALVLLPGVASAAGWITVNLNYNGKVQTFRIPIEGLEGGTYKCNITIPKLPGQTLSKPAPQPAPQPKPQPAPGDDKPITPPVKGLTADEQQMLNLVNAERVKAGLKPLEIDMRLVDISRKKSKDMIENNYFGHTSPTYGTPFDALKAAGISYRYAGENIAGAPTVQRAHEGLMNSPGHRANILNPNYNRIGIGIVDGGPYGKMFTQTFIGTN
ncbi:CAP domain-containing protein [Thermosediminibacter oceani]|uniref:SCP-like extracellular n=1 Tax=Thermosediminibacter oceani (strain ATCC BAA-1034 / DSM 16646 / JW/IW-1228P) TaxID=555079 RepID=D9RZD7_THEOJ|nr:CAP domain-containing protein [Thermosediminibacter oceani]ADL06835.1 SCP-like extracellular [Thermosediminibacter oceani DSM 16646]